MSEIIDRIDKAYATADLDFIEHIMRSEKARALEAGEVGQSDLIVASNELGSFLRGAGRFDEALECFNTAQETMELIGQSASRQYIVLLLNKAGTYRFMKDFNAALELYLDIRSKLDEAGRSSTKEYATLLNNLSLLHYDRGEFEDSLQLAQGAAKILDIIGTDDTELAITYQNIANLYLARSDVKRARKFAEDALSIYEGFGYSSGHYAAVLNTLASIDFCEGSYEEALCNFQKAVIQTEKDFGRNQDYAEGLLNISRAYAAMGDAEHADEYASRGHFILEADSKVHKP